MFRSLTVRLPLLLAIPVSLSMLLLVLWTGDSLRDLIVERETQAVIRTADAAMRSLEGYFERSGTLVRDMAARPAVREAMRTGNGTAVQPWLEERMSRDGDYWALLTFDRDGQVVAGVTAGGQKLSGVDVGDRDYFKATLSGGELFRSDMFRPDAGGDPGFSLAAPAREQNGDFMGGAVAVMDWRSFITKYIQPLRPSDGGEIYMWDENLRCLAHPVPSRVLADDSEDPMAREVRRRGRGSVTHGIPGKERVMAFTTSPGNGWVLGISIPRADLEAAGGDLLNSLIWLAVIPVAVTMLLSGFFAHRYVSARASSLSKYAETMAEFQPRPYETESGDELDRLARGLDSLVDNARRNITFARGMLDGIGVPCAVVDERDRLVYVNEAMTSTIRRTGGPERWNGTSAREFFPAEAGRGLTAAALAYGRTSRDVEIRLNGELRRYRAFASPFESGETRLGAVCLWIDVTESVQERDALKERLKRVEDARHAAARLAVRLEDSGTAMEKAADEAGEKLGEVTSSEAEVAAAAEGYRSSAETLASSATDAETALSTVLARAEEGNEMTAEASRHSESLRQDAAALVARLDSLAVHVRGVAELLDSVDGLAEEAHLAVFNAALAGESGTGRVDFIALADGVRQVAEMTGDGVKALRDAVDALNLWRQDTETDTRDLLDALVRGSALARQSEKTVQTLTEHARAARDALESVSENAREQARSADGVASLGEGTAELAERASALADFVRASSRTVSDAAAKARDLADIAGERK